MKEKNDESIDITELEGDFKKTELNDSVNQKKEKDKKCCNDCDCKNCDCKENEISEKEELSELEYYELRQYRRQDNEYDIDEIIYEEIESKKVAKSIGIFLMIWGIILVVYIILMEYVGINDIKVYFIVIGVTLVIGYKITMKYILYKIKKRKGEWENG